MIKELVMSKRNCSIENNKNFTGKQHVAARKESFLGKHVEEKLFFLTKLELNKNCATVMLETLDHKPKHPCLGSIEDPHIRAMLVLISGCDVLSSGLKQGVDAKLCNEVRNKFCSSNEIKKKSIV